jgi:hypothetical protein
MAGLQQAGVVRGSGTAVSQENGVRVTSFTNGVPAAQAQQRYARPRAQYDLSFGPF